MIRRMLDLFCGAGGAAMGYHRAFGPDVEIVGVDIEPQPRYPFEFIQADALEFMRDGRGDGFDFYHASPPCQRWSVASALWDRVHPDLLTPTREWLKAIRRPYVIENVPGAPLVNPLMLCGTMFGLQVKRHRLFETSPMLYFMPATCQCSGKTTASHRSYSSFENGAELITVAGKNFAADDGRVAMGIDWMTRDELAQAIPPAYTEWIGNQILDALRHEQLDEEERQMIRFDYNSDFVEAMTC